MKLCIVRSSTERIQRDDTSQDSQSAGIAQFERMEIYHSLGHEVAGDRLLRLCSVGVSWVISVRQALSTVTDHR